ncbi:putative dCMP deaminase [Pseudomonas phage PaMx11]|uniref:dCMP deaminase n=1 Tax=Pseudomonas phage PaMx11 TaxID=1175657 RepID=A0A0S0N809_BPPAM|nr:putative dCMP deaminase [Pseudomonas phage PaMx11]ALH23730.1 putative dCMP deaminase [Pseudomonas phage PaMx11]
MSKPALIHCHVCTKGFLSGNRACPHCGAEVAQERDPLREWDERWMELARHYAGWSKDPSTRLGAVVVAGGKRQVGQGYNGFPRGVEDAPERYAERELKYQLIVHAELNAVLTAGRDCQGATIYVWPLPPCPECTKAIIQAGIRRVVMPRECPRPEWRVKFESFSKIMLDEAGVEVSYV